MLVEISCQKHTQTEKSYRRWPNTHVNLLILFVQFSPFLSNFRKDFLVHVALLAMQSTFDKKNTNSYIKITHGIACIW